MFDLIIKNATIYDGTGKEGYVADIAILGDRIKKIGKLEEEAEVTLNCEGLSVMPGFIDTHVHSDMMLLYDRQHINGISQGITTEILGQDGLSYAPLSNENLNMYAQYLKGLDGYDESIKLDFNDTEGFLHKFHKKTAINVAYQIPHGAIRLESAGFLDIPLKGYALDKAKELMRQNFEQGAVAFSTGLSYYPCSYSDTEELIQLCKVAKEFDAPFVIHTRSVFRDKPFDHVKEAIDVARESGVRLHFSHFRTGPETAGQVESVLRPIEEGIEEGLDITVEFYPYYSGSGYAVIFLPPFAVEGGYEETLNRLANRTLRREILDGIKHNTIGCEGTFTHLKKNVEYIGKTFEEVAKMRGQMVEDMICDILLEEELEVGYFSNPTEDMALRKQMDDDFVELIKKPYYMVGSDSIPLGEKPHPRTFGTFPKVIRLAREKGFEMSKLANRLSYLPAKTFRLKDRGHIGEGKFADLTIMDIEKVKDNATYKNARVHPTGIKHVIVNGKIAVLNEKATGLFLGHSLKRNSSWR